MDATDGDVDIAYEASLEGFDRAVDVEPPSDREVVALDEAPELSEQLNAGLGS